MSTSQRPQRALVTDSPVAPPFVDLSDPAMVKRWAVDLREQIEDVIAAGLDATAPPGQRRLGRLLAREKVREAAGSIERLFAAVGLAAEEERGRGKGGSGKGESAARAEGERD